MHLYKEVSNYHYHHHYHHSTVTTILPTVVIDIIVVMGHLMQDCRHLRQSGGGRGRSLSLWSGTPVASFGLLLEKPRHFDGMLTANAEQATTTFVLKCLCRANSYTPLVLYLPCLEAWALETATLTNEEVEDGLAASAGRSAAGPTPQRNAQPSITPLKPYPATISPFR